MMTEKDILDFQERHPLGTTPNTLIMHPDVYRAVKRALEFDLGVRVKFGKRAVVVRRDRNGRIKVKR